MTYVYFAMNTFAHSLNKLQATVMGKVILKCKLERQRTQCTSVSFLMIFDIYSNNCINTKSHLTVKQKKKQNCLLTSSKSVIFG